MRWLLCLTLATLTRHAAAEPPDAGLEDAGFSAEQLEDPSVADPHDDDAPRAATSSQDTDEDDGEPLPDADGNGPPPLAKAPATRYVRLRAKQCFAEARRRKLPVVWAGPTRGVPIPARITGPLHGVRIHSGLPKSQWATSRYEIIDCRMVLALDDFAKLLAAHDVVELVHMSAYRPPPKKWPAAKPGKRHGAALALDAGTFVKKDGTRLNVEKHFRRRRRAPACPKTLPKGSSAETKEIRALFCEARNQGLFHVMLGPNFNWAHRNHFHLEINPAPRGFYVH